MGEYTGIRILLSQIWINFIKSLKYLWRLLINCKLWIIVHVKTAIKLIFMLKWVRTDLGKGCDILLRLEPFNGMQDTPVWKFPEEIIPILSYKIPKIWI